VARDFDFGFGGAPPVGRLPLVTTLGYFTFIGQLMVPFETSTFPDCPARIANKQIGENAERV
jgi:hypothetical protein